MAGREKELVKTVRNVIRYTILLVLLRVGKSTKRYTRPRFMRKLLIYAL